MRVRDLHHNLQGDSGKIRPGVIGEIPFDRISADGEVQINVSENFKCKIRPVKPASPVFKSAPSGKELRIYRCVGDWTLESQSLSKAFTARYAGKTVFQLLPKSASWTLKGSNDALKLHLADGTERALKAGETVEIPGTDLAGTELRLLPEGTATAQVWRFGLTGNPVFADFAPKDKAFQEDLEWFKKSLAAAAAGLVLFGVMAWLWPASHKEQELVPAQFAQILMPKQEKKAAPAAASESGSSAKVAQDAPKKVREAAVVQAFRAKALSNAVNGLLKGGMTKLLAQSDFVSGTSRSAEARRILDTKNSALQPTTELGSLTGAKNVQIASVGGGGNGEGGHGIGYGKGEHASIKGQGKGFVPFVQADASGSVVDEGLTRDEVGEVIHRHLSEIRYCYESAMLRSPDIEGKLMAAFVINGSGAVKTAEAKSSTLPDPRLDDCIIRRLVTWPFPKPRGGVEVSVTYPFIFKTLGR
ncbi:MAG: AgmX/PglI C-terminal domain-containing protein [Oligoflexia bacterium]|nr:AgmX/PglI C-terminal domain-containing protein [Oligoflexia bacterium]